MRCIRMQWAFFYEYVCSPSAWLGYPQNGRIQGRETERDLAFPFRDPQFRWGFPGFNGSLKG